MLSDLVRRQRCTWHLDHSTYEEVDAITLLLEECLSGLTDHTSLLVKLLDDTDEGYHNLRMRLDALLLEIEASA